LAVLTRVLVHAYSVHASAAGALLGLVVSTQDLYEESEHTWHPFSVGLPAPVLALFAAGVTVGDLPGTGFTRALLVSELAVGMSSVRDDHVMVRA
jgi:Na+/H+ antiporter NhaA